MVRKRDAILAGVNLLDLAPVQLAPWEERDGRAVVERVPPPARGVYGWLLRLSFYTGVKKLRLDALGSAVWRRLDGRRTMGEISGELRREFGPECEPLEERLGTFCAMLRREHMIGYPGYDDQEIAAWRGRRIAEAP